MKNTNGGGKKENKSIVNMKADQAPTTKTHSGKGKGKATSGGSSSKQHSKTSSDPHHPNGATKNGYHPNGTQTTSKITTAPSKVYQSTSLTGFKSFASVVTSTLPNKSGAPLPLGFLPTPSSDQGSLKGNDHSPYLAAASFGRKTVPNHTSESTSTNGSVPKETRTQHNTKKNNKHNCSLQQQQPLVDSNTDVSNFTEDDKPPTIPRLGGEGGDALEEVSTLNLAALSEDSCSSCDSPRSISSESCVSSATSSATTSPTNNPRHETVNNLSTSDRSNRQTDDQLHWASSGEDPLAKEPTSDSLITNEPLSVKNPESNPNHHHPHSNGFHSKRSNNSENGHTNGSSYHTNGRYRNHSKNGKSYNPRYRIDSVPWLHLPNATPTNLHEEIWNFYKYISPTPEELKMRNEVLKRVNAVITDLWPTAEVKVFGSYATQSLLPTSDIDIVVMGAQPTHTQPIFALSEELLKHKGMTKLHVIPTAKVPVIKMTDTQTGCLVDISFNLNSGPENAKLMLEHFEHYPFLLPIAVLIKYFLYMRGLNEPYKGGVGSFTLLLMIVSLLQQRGKAKREKGEDEEEKDLSNVLLGFLEFYGKTFDYHTFGISIRDGGFFFNKKERDWLDSENPDLLAIEDPSNEANDVGRLSFGMLDVKYAFEQAFKELTDALHRQHPGDTYKSVLRNIVWVEPWLEEQRRYITHLFGEQSGSMELGLNGAAMVPPRLRRPSLAFNYNNTSKRKNHNTSTAASKEVTSTPV